MVHEELFINSYEMLDVKRYEERRDLMMLWHRECHYVCRLHQIRTARGHGSLTHAVDLTTQCTLWRHDRVGNPAIFPKIRLQRDAVVFLYDPHTKLIWGGKSYLWHGASQRFLSTMLGQSRMFSWTRENGSFRNISCCCIHQKYQSVLFKFLYEAYYSGSSDDIEI